MKRKTQKKGHKPKILRLGELFCGPGGLAQGALSAKIRTGEYRMTHCWATDWDSDTCETYRTNICPEERDTVVCQDIRKCDIRKFRKFGEIDCLAFGFPCNDFSVVGERRGVRGHYGPLYTYGIEVLKEYQPKCFVAENVGGLRSANDGEAAKTIFSAMKDAGYRIYPHLYKFEEYGLPQMRHRIIIVGIRKDLPYEFRIPVPRKGAEKMATCKNAIENPPIPSNAPNNEVAKTPLRPISPTG